MSWIWVSVLLVGSLLSKIEPVFHARLGELLLNWIRSMNGVKRGWDFIIIRAKLILMLVG